MQGPTTAEYAALLRGVELAQLKGVDYIAVFSDSRILVNQVNEVWGHSTDHLKKLCGEARAALANFQGFQVSWIPREWNARADHLAGRALKGDS